MRSFWERSGPTEGGGSTPQVCGHVHMVCMCTPPEGWFHEPRSEAESALRKKEIMHPAGALTCTCTRSHMCVPESAHTCTCTYAPAGCMKSTHPKRNDRSKARSRKHNRTLTPAHTCDRVKIVRAESAPRMRTPAVSSRARARIYMHPKGACIRTEGAVYEPRSEAESAPRKRKNKPSHEDAPSVHPLNTCTEGCMYPHPKGAV